MRREAKEDRAGETREGKEEMRLLTAAVVSALAPVGAVQTVDALGQYDDVIISAEVMEECHLIFVGQFSAEKLRALGYAAFQQLGGSMVETRSGSHYEAAVKADHDLKARTEADIAYARELVVAKGCPALTPHAREVLESFRQ